MPVWWMEWEWEWAWDDNRLSLIMEEWWVEEQPSSKMEEWWAWEEKKSLLIMEEWWAEEQPSSKMEDVVFRFIIVGRNEVIIAGNNRCLPGCQRACCINSYYPQKNVVAQTGYTAQYNPQVKYQNQVAAQQRNLQYQSPQRVQNVTAQQNSPRKIQQQPLKV